MSTTAPGITCEPPRCDDAGQSLPPATLAAALMTTAVSAARVNASAAIPPAPASPVADAVRTSPNVLTVAAVACEILSVVTQAQTPADAQQRLLEELRRRLGATYVGIGSVLAGTLRCRLDSIAGVEQFDRCSDAARQWEAAFSECLIAAQIQNQPGTISQPAAASRDDATPTAVTAAHRPSTEEKLAACRALAAAMGGQTIRSMILRDPQDQPLAVCLLAGNLKCSDEAFQKLIECLAKPLGAWWQLLVRANENSATKLIKTAVRACLGRRGVMAAVGIAALALMPLISLPYRVDCACVVEPVTRRFVAAPFAGQFEKSLVKPGDIVAAGQALARMDGRELRMELAGLEAERDRAAKDRDVHLAAGRVANAQVARLEIERLDQRRKLVQSRFEHLEIQSPLAGVVIHGDLERSEGAPVTVGQSLFEIAPLDRMVVEIAVPETEVAHIVVGQQVRFRFQSQSEGDVEGVISSIHPRAEIRDEQNVFIAEVVIDNARQSLRPGMHGRATIVSGEQPLSWILFHKPWKAATRWLGG